MCSQHEAGDNLEMQFLMSMIQLNTSQHHHLVTMTRIKFKQHLCTAST